MDRDEVKEYVERSQQLIGASPQMNEENTKVRLVQPLLELLGWDFYSTEVELEYTVPMASGSTHVDYALLIGDSPVMFVEVKPVRSDLTSGNIRQLKSYMRQELDVDWGILTNGKTFEVLTKGRHQNSGEEVSVVQFDLDDLAENPEMLELLSKESIRSGRADEIAEQVAQTNEAIHFLQENEDEVTVTVSSAIESETGEIPIDLNEQSREFVQGLVSVLQEQRQFVSETPPAQPNKTEEGSTEGSDNSDDLKPTTNQIAGTILRSEIEGDADATVAVFPTRESGLPFLKENNAWGFVRVGSEFEFVAMYVTGDVREVRYIATVRDIVSPEDAELVRPPEEYVDRARITEDKKVVRFEPDSLYELEDPVPYNTKYPQSLQYTTLGALRTAETTDDML